jgi:hypothetical protein
MKLQSNKYLLVFILVLGLTGGKVFAQEKNGSRDTLKLYENIESFSERNRVTQILYRLIFNPTASDDHLDLQEEIYKVHNIYGIYEGKIIRKIHIQTLEPFGSSVFDTLSTPQNFLLKLGNTLHITTNRRVIRNLMLIKEGQPFNAWMVKESERLIRTRTYITDVAFFINQVSEESDSVDIMVFPHDRWSIMPEGTVSASQVVGGIRENNFLGWGHDFFAGVRWNHETGNHSLRTRYFIPNIRNTYINALFHYGTFENGSFIRRAAVERPFFSPLARWAGGIDMGQYLRTDSIISPDYSPFRYNSQDLWGGYSIRLFGGISEYRRSTKLILASRVLRVRYTEKPGPAVDTLNYFSNHNFYLGTIGISARRYVRDQFVFRFGFTEDIPVGQLFNITAGYQQRDPGNRIYLSARFAKSDYYNWGFLGTYIGYSTFYNLSAENEEGMLNAGIDYFTPLIEIGKWRMRQFIKSQATFGFDRAPWDSLTLNRQYGINGFNSPSLSGIHRIMLSSQTQVYAPGNILGFHFGPYLLVSLGMLANSSGSFENSRIFSQFGIGFLVKNDNLVLSTFQFSFSFYPVIPGRGNNIFRFNTFQTTDFELRDFEIRKPGFDRFR